MKRLALIAAAFTLSACGPSSDIKAAVKERLVDPDSAKFGKVMISANGKRACIDVNSKNRMGGYTGMSGMFVTKDKSSGKWDTVFPVAFDQRCNTEDLESLSKLD